jgi:hypothetical protein
MAPDAAAAAMLRNVGQSMEKGMVEAGRPDGSTTSVLSRSLTMLTSSGLELAQ